MATQTDKRIIKTRTSIKKAFMELVQTMEIGKISISELAAKALINRSTFYLHYEDVQAVAADIESALAEGIATLIEDFAIDNIYESTFLLLKRLAKKLEENKEIKTYIIYSTNSDYIIAKMKEIFVEKTMQSILKTFDNVSEKDIKYPIVYATSGVIDSYVKWVREDSNTVPLDDMMNEIGIITEHILSKIMNS